MILFVLIALSLTLFTLWLAIRPLLNADQSSHLADGQNANIMFLRSRLKELEEQHSTGRLHDQEFEELKQELESNLALEIEVNQTQRDNRTSGDSMQLRTTARNWALVLMLVVPISAALVYWAAGNYNVIGLMAERASQQSEQQSQFDPAEVSKMIADVETRLQDNPDDIEGWQVLSNVYLGTGRYADAENAYLQILRLVGPNPNVYASLADASALAAQGQLAGKPMEYVTQALELDPQQPQALWLAGLNAAQLGDNDTAKTYWETLLPLLADMPERQNELSDILAQMESEGLVAPSQSQSQPVEEVAQSQVVSRDGVTLAIEIAPAIISQLSPQTMVFVIARAVDGSPAPLAVKRYTLATLPEQVNLSDADAMLADVISNYEMVEVSARISVSGQPGASAGDFEAPRTQVATGTAQLIKLVINQEVK